MAKRVATKDENSRLFVVYTETVDPTMFKDYEHGIKFLIEKMQGANVKFESWETSQHDFSYSRISRLQSLDELQTVRKQQRLRKLIQSVGDGTRKRWEAMCIPAIRSTRLLVVERADDYCYWPAHSVVKEPKYVNLDVQRLRVGADLDRYKSLITQGWDAMRKADYPLEWTAYRPVVGDGGAVYAEGHIFYYVAPYDSMSQYYEQHPFTGGLQKGMGKEDTKQFIIGVLKCMERLENLDIRLRPDLSYRLGHNKTKVKRGSASRS